MNLPFSYSCKTRKAKLSIFLFKFLAIIECPPCGMICNPTNIIENQFLLELASNSDDPNKNADMKCSNCGDDAMATSYCTDCSEFICDNCVQAHQR